MATKNKKTIKKRKVNIEFTEENLILIKKASAKVMRSQRNFISTSALKQAKEVLKK